MELTWALTRRETEQVAWRQTRRRDTSVTTLRWVKSLGLTDSSHTIDSCCDNSSSRHTLENKLLWRSENGGEALEGRHDLRAPAKMEAQSPTCCTRPSCLISSPPPPAPHPRACLLAVPVLPLCLFACWQQERAEVTYRPEQITVFFTFRYIEVSTKVIKFKNELIWTRQRARAWCKHNAQFHVFRTQMWRRTETSPWKQSVVSESGFTPRHSTGSWHMQATGWQTLCCQLFVFFRFVFVC